MLLPLKGDIAANEGQCYKRRMAAMMLQTGCDPAKTPDDGMLRLQRYALETVTEWPTTLGIHSLLRPQCATTRMCILLCLANVMRLTDIVTVSEKQCYRL